MLWRRVRDYFRRSRARQAELKYKAFVKKARQTVRKRPGAAAASRATALAASLRQWLPVAAWALGTVATCVPPALLLRLCRNDNTARPPTGRVPED